MSGVTELYLQLDALKRLIYEFDAMMHDFSARLLDRSIAKGHPVRRSVRRSVCHTRDPCLNGSVHQNKLKTLR